MLGLQFTLESASLGGACLRALVLTCLCARCDVSGVGLFGACRVAPRRTA